MFSRHRALARGWMAVALLAIGAGVARGQGPTINPDSGGNGGGASTLLGNPPGSGAAQQPGASGGAQYLGGRPGPTAPHSPTSVTTPSQDFAIPTAPSVAPPADLSPTPLPVYGALAYSSIALDEGPVDGLSLDQAIERYVHQNPDLRAQYLEIPQADADILTASLRSNPVFYADAQLVPYGQYTNARPGGQTQYDVNISYPFDVTHKRRARTVVAQRARRVLEAMYQDAVRQGIDNLYTAYVDALQARGAVKFAEVGVEGLRDVVRSTEALVNRGEQPSTAYSKVRLQLRLAEADLRSSREQYQRARRALGLMLAMTPSEAEKIELRGSLRDTAPPPPPLEEMVGTALQARPDVLSFRLGVSRAMADVKSAQANILQDIYVLYQPYTFQDNSWQGLKSATSWAVGVTAPIPVYNRNQGAILRARLNVNQTRLQLVSAEKTAVNDVRQAEQAYHTSLENLQLMEKEVLPDAERVLADSWRLFQRGENTLIDYLGARSDYNNTARQYLNALVTHRRAMLDLNTALGQRILP